MSLQNPTLLLEKCKLLISGLWVESHYNFDKQQANQKLTQLFIQFQVEEGKVIISCLQDLLHCIADFYGVSIKGVRSPTRKREVVKVRQMYSFLAKTVYFSNTPLETIGMEVREDYDHATVMYGRDTVRSLIDVGDKQIKREVFILIDKIEFEQPTSSVID